LSSSRVTGHQLSAGTRADVHTSSSAAAAPVTALGGPSGLAGGGHYVLELTQRRGARARLAAPSLADQDQSSSLEGLKNRVDLGTV